MSVVGSCRTECVYLLGVGQGQEGTGGMVFFLPLSVEYGLQVLPEVKAQTVTSVLLLVMKYGCVGGKCWVRVPKGSQEPDSAMPSLPLLP